ncbi:hypothetical protein ACIG56_26695 [Nocardia fusca]|uniref:hypothetical protein n=1 Tax=Nocardia fusca TaxID=941183 RepID=UPI0037CC4483
MKELGEKYHRTFNAIAALLCMVIAAIQSIASRLPTVPRGAAVASNLNPRLACGRCAGEPLWVGEVLVSDWFTGAVAPPAMARSWPLSVLLGSRMKAALFGW